MRRFFSWTMALCCCWSCGGNGEPGGPTPPSGKADDFSGATGLVQDTVTVRLGKFELLGPMGGGDGFGGSDAAVMDSAGFQLPATEHFGFVDGDPNTFRFAGVGPLRYARNHRFNDGQGDRSTFRRGGQTSQLPLLRLQNRHVVMEVMPILGGRIWDVRRPGGPSQLYHSRNPGDSLPRLIPVAYGLMGWWLNAGGAEFSFPWHEHGSVFYKPFAYKIVSATYPVKLIERAVAIARDGQPRTLEATFTLGEDDTSVRVDVRVSGPGSGAYQAWINAMIAPGMGAGGVDDAVNPDVRFVSSVRRLRYHSPEHPGDPSAVGNGRLGDEGDFPGWGGKDLSSYQAWLGYRDTGLFARAYDGVPYFGSYSASGGGLVRSVIGAPRTGMKLWCFGKDLRSDGADRYADATQGELMAQTGSDAYFEVWTSGNTDWFGDNWVGDGGHQEGDAQWTERWGLMAGDGTFDPGVLQLNPTPATGGGYQDPCPGNAHRVAREPTRLRGAPESGGYGPSLTVLSPGTTIVLGSEVAKGCNEGGSACYTFRRVASVNGEPVAAFLAGLGQSASEAWIADTADLLDCGAAGPATGGAAESFDGAGAAVDDGYVKGTLAQGWTIWKDNDGWAGGYESARRTLTLGGGEQAVSCDRCSFGLERIFAGSGSRTVRVSFRVTSGSGWVEVLVNGALVKKLQQTGERAEAQATVNGPATVRLKGGSQGPGVGAAFEDVWIE